MKQISCAAGLLLIAATPVLAAERLEMDVALVSDYVFRGISRSDNEPALQGSIEYSHSQGLYAGIWASTVDTVNDSDIELDLYGGFAGEIKPRQLGWDVGLISYHHDESRDNRNEIYASLSFDPSWHQRSTVIAKLSYDWDEGNSVIEAVARITLGGGIKLSVHPGYVNIDEVVDGATENYSFLRLGVGKLFALSRPLKSLDAEISYSDTNLDPESDLNDNIWWLSLKFNL